MVREGPATTRSSRNKRLNTIIAQARQVRNGNMDECVRLDHLFDLLMDLARVVNDCE